MKRPRLSLLVLGILALLALPGQSFAEEAGRSLVDDALNWLRGKETTAKPAEPGKTAPETGVQGSTAETVVAPPAQPEKPAPTTDAAQAKPEAPKPAAPKVPGSMAEINLSFSPVVKQVAGSVVNVYGERQQRETQSPFAGDPFFERFFGQMPQRRRGQTSLGSGVVVSEDGLIITNNHVIENMDVVRIALADGREFDCEIVIKDDKSDLAILRVKDAQARFKPIEIADSDGVEVGDLVLAIGNPFGVGQTVTMGIVSAVSRTLAGVNDYGFFIQTDASINPGNSGGALVDMKGRLIGINTMIFSRSGGSVGIGYAIPSNMTQIILRSAVTGTKVARPWLGAGLQPVTAEIAESLGLELPRGALVASIDPRGPAAKAGLQPGDVILGVNDNEIEHPDALGYRLDTIGVGGTAVLAVLRRGQNTVVEVKLAAPPETVPRDELELPQASVLWGAKVANLSPAVAQELGLPSEREGVVVTGLARGSPAAINGIRPGDIVREVNGVEIARTTDLEQVTSQRLRAWQFVVERGGRTVVMERNGNFFRQFVR